MPAVTSRQNPIVARYRAAARGETAGHLLVDGVHLLAEALDAGVHAHEAAVLADCDRPDVVALVARLEQRQVSLTVVSAPVMAALSPVQSPSPIVAIGRRPDAEALVYGAAALVVIAVDIQEPGNLGAIVRVAEAGGASGVVCAGACADPFGWKALRGSMGSAFRLPIVVRATGEDAIDEARRHGCRIVATAPRGGQPLFDADLAGPLAILIGSEGQGLTASQLGAAETRVTIPMAPPVESLNAAVSAALLVYEARRQRLEKDADHSRTRQTRMPQ